MSGLIRYQQALDGYEGKNKFNDSEKKNLALNLLLDLRESISNDLFRSAELNKGFPDRISSEDMLLYIDIYSSIIILGGLINNDLIYEFLEYISKDSEEEGEYLNLFFSNIPLFFPKYIEAFNCLGKNNKTEFSGYLHNLVYKGIFDFSVSSTRPHYANLYRYFYEDINYIQELHDIFSEKYNYNFYKKKKLFDNTNESNIKRICSGFLENSPITNSDQPEIAFSLLLSSREIIFSETKGKILDILGDLPQTELTKLELNIDVYTLFIVSICLKDDVSRDKFFKFFNSNSGKTNENLQYLFSKIEKFFPKYYEAYEKFYNKQFPIFGDFLYELILKGNYEFAVPFGTSSFSPLLVMVFTNDLNLILEIKKSIHEKYNLEI